MQVNIEHIVICSFICVAMISQGIVFSVSVKEGELLEEESKAPTIVIGFLIGVLLLLAVGIAVLIFKLVGR